ncbi:mannitol-1-phosphate 5-dehydrogenase [Coccidioides immitis H538.4]|uniref:Mannitol-1-phosphate 5-dehydrogenase n=1 Tax=Coccidioides immitis H538.4 TaxID=396776 RepID=A0A0J8UU75_COCIT|nr:mannitol-1-phosphate 5-dehydrogenase [Coccidioides immitis H538.4]
MGKKAVHFGGGNIGRGFVGEFLHESDYEVVFVDVMDSIIDALQGASSYKVTEVISEISTADVVTCAVGPNILKFIAPPIAKGIDARTIERPLAVVACENAIGATDTLHKFVKENTDPSRVESLSSRARFANSAIDRIVPTQDPDSGLDVKIEKFYEWVVEKTPFGEWGHPDIQAILWVRQSGSLH